MTLEQATALVQLASAIDAGEVVEYLSQQELSPLQARAWLDKRFAPQISIAILECLSCRQHFAHKFQNAFRWLLMRQAAEQASSSIIASWRADYLSNRFYSVKTITEFGTGIGGDSVFLCRNFEVMGFEADAARAHLAQANQKRLSPDAFQLSIDIESQAVAQLSGQLLFCDPSRREQKRLYKPDSWSPPLDSVLLHPRFINKIVKAAPGLDCSTLSAGVEVHFLSLKGQLKEAMLISSPDNKASSSRHAWLWAGGSDPPLHLENSDPRSEVDLLAPRDSLVIAPPAVGGYLHNPDPSILRAGLLHQLASKLDAFLVHPKIGYLHGTKASESPWATSFRIKECMPLNWSRLNSSLQATGWGDFEYLSRGVPFSQEEVLARTSKARKQIKGRSPLRGSLIIWRDSRGYSLVLAERESRLDFGSPSL